MAPSPAVIAVQHSGPGSASKKPWYLRWWAITAAVLDIAEAGHAVVQHDALQQPREHLLVNGTHHPDHVLTLNIG